MILAISSYLENKMFGRLVRTIALTALRSAHSQTVSERSLGALPRASRRLRRRGPRSFESQARRIRSHHVPSSQSKIQLEATSYALNGEPGVYTADWAETPSGRDFRL